MSEEERRFEPGLKLARSRMLNRYLDGEFIFPIGAEISVSGSCDAQCPDCFYRQDPEEMGGLDKEFFRSSRMEELVKELGEVGTKAISWTGGGEPTLHPEFPSFVQWASQAGLQQGLFTNGLKHPEYDPGLLKWIRVTQTNKQLNEGVLEELRGCKTLGICINYGDNFSEETVRAALEIAERLESMKSSEDHSTYVQVRPALRVRGRTHEVRTPETIHPLLKVTDYKFIGHNSERNYSQCEGFHFVPFIWQDGDVDICAYYRKDPRFNLGNLYDEGEEGKLRRIMEEAPKTAEVIDTCQVCCKLNSMNTMINNMRSLEDVNFP